jgi:hypothetical protein
MMVNAYVPAGSGITVSGVAEASTSDGEPEDKGPPAVPLCGHDVTDWFLMEVNTHAGYWSNVSKTIPRGASILLKFLQYALRIPYKWMDFGTPACPTIAKPCRHTVMLCETCISKTELGGIMFGAMGVVAGIQEELLVGVAANGFRLGLELIPPAVDSVLDIAGIVAGINVGKILRFQGSITRRQFCEAVRQPTDPVMIWELRDKFQPDSPAYKWLGKLSGLFLKDMRVAGCTECAVPAPNYGHSSFAEIGPTGSVVDGCSKIYGELNNRVDWPDRYKKDCTREM